MAVSFDEVCANLDELAKEVSAIVESHNAQSVTNLVSEIESLRKLALGTSQDLIGAHYGYLRAKCKLDEMQQQVPGSERKFWFMLIFEGTMVMLLLTLWILYSIPGKSGHASWGDLLIAYQPAMICAWWGAMGSVLFAIYVLYEGRMQGIVKAVSDGWLLIKPVTGALVGVLVWLCAEAGLAGAGQVQNTMFLGLLAFFAGWSERSFLTMLQQKMSKLGGFTP